MSSGMIGRSGSGKSFPVTKGVTGTAKAEPNLIGRQDLDHGLWSVNDCEARRGQPSTDVSNRVMFAPSQDDELARTVRAHELMHSKVSPNAEQWDKFVERGFASDTALRVTEELRVNFLCEQAGLPMKTEMYDGSELSMGERLASTGDWAGAVAMTIATVNTAGHKDFLTGIRRHNRTWGEELLKIGKRALREIKKAHKTGTLARTQEYDGIAPYGFTHTERIAEWVDRLAEFPPPPRPPRKGKCKGEGEGEVIGRSDGDKTSHGNEGDYEDGEGNKTGVRPERIQPHDGHRPRHVGQPCVLSIAQCRKCFTVLSAKSESQPTLVVAHADCTA